MQSSVTSKGPGGSKKAATSPLVTLVGLALLRLAAARKRGPSGDVPGGRGPSGGPRRADDLGSRKAPEARGQEGRSHSDEHNAETEKDRGRAAETPADIPAKGWKDVLWRTYEEINNDRILAVAAGVTFYGLLSLFPAITALVSMYGLFADAATINDHLTALSGFLPAGATEIIGDQVKRITSHDEGALGFAFFFGLGLALWSANAGMKAIFDALNVAYGEAEKRGFFALNLRSLAFTLGAIVFGLVAIGGIVVVPVVLEFFGLGEAVEWILWIVRWPILLLIIVGGLAVLYRYGPSRDEVEWMWISPGSILAAIVWIVGSMLFSWYVANFANYNETYGSLGAAIGFMTWLWLSTTIVLVGAELNAEIEHQTAKDTTKGKPEPMGSRGAKMADTLGEAKA